MRYAPCLALCALPSLAVADTITYGNARFGYSVTMPARFHADPPPENGDGRRFADPEADVEILVWAGYPLDGLAEERELRIGILRNEGADLSYMPQGDGWFVLSGTEKHGDRLFYVRAIETRDCAGGDILANVRIAYAKTARDRIEPVIGRITKSLTGCAPE